MHHIYKYTYVHEHTHHWLNQAFAMADGGLANRIMVHCLVPMLLKYDDTKSPSYWTLLCTRTNRNNDSKSIGAGMDVLGLLLAVTIVTFIVQLMINVTVIATTVLLIMI